ncbi:Cys-Gln thioester bond-forming surface protein, partial [Catellicoccus marimammalium]
MKKYRTSVSLLSLIGLLSISFSSNAEAIEKGDYYCYRTTAPGKNEAISEYDFFTMVDENGKESIVYCYNATRPQPLSNKETAEKLCRFDRFGFYEGMDSLGTDRGNKEKIDQIAAILMAGYPNDGLGEQMNRYAYECYQKVHRDYTYTFDDFKREMTQRAIWKADRPRGKYTDHYPYAEALYRYGKQYPLDQQTAYDDQLIFQTNTNEIIDPQHPMIIDEKTRKSDQFQIKNYNGLVSIENPSTEVKIIEEQSHKEVTTLKPNTYYYAELTNGQQKESTLDIKYMKMDHSYFYQYVTSPYPFGLQNMVQANIKKKKLPIDIKIEPVTSSSEEASKEVETSKDTSSFEESSKEVETSKDTSS